MGLDVWAKSNYRGRKVHTVFLNMSQADWKEMGFGNYPVTEIGHCTLTMSDGIDIAMKVWLPCKQDDIKEHFPYFAKEENLKWTKEIYQGNDKGDDMTEIFPTILEYIPYAKDSSMTLTRDHAKHSLFCSHGFVDFRADLRGCGASSGFYFDEYDRQELEDCVEVLEWIASQPWSNKAAGMCGKSWGGFNALQIAYRQPEILKAAISLYSTDSRFFDDIHYQGNTLIGNAKLPWSSVMFSINARPPHPRYFPTVKEWKEFWLKRLNTAGQSFLASWMHHQHRADPYWLHGSIDTNYNNIKCPVLVIGGHADGYTNAALRMAATLNESSKTIIGPWAHEWPNTSLAGPQIDFYKLAVDWWTCHLKGDRSSTDVSSWPRLQLYIRDSFKPAEVVGNISGSWVSIPEWKSMLKEFNTLSNMQSEEIGSNLKCLYFGSHNNLLFQKAESNTSEPVELHPHALQGKGFGAYFPCETGFFEDQTTANENSQCWITDVLERDVVFTGFGKVFVCIEAKQAGRYCLQVRVCDQIPNGESTYITRGCQNLTLSEDGWVANKFPANEKKLICIDLNGVGQRINAGHRLLISITPSYFPTLYPAIDSEGIIIYPTESMVIYQTLTCEQLKHTTTFTLPPPILNLPREKIKEGHFTMKTENKDGKYVFEFNDYKGLESYPTMKYQCEFNKIEKFVTDEKVTFGDISSTISIMSCFDLDDQGKIKTLVETNQEMTGDKQHFHLQEELKVYINDEEAFNKTWDNVIPRKFV